MKDGTQNARGGTEYKIYMECKKGNRMQVVAQNSRRDTQRKKGHRIHGYWKQEGTQSARTEVEC
jgi:ribosomal protein L21